MTKPRLLHLPGTILLLLLAIVATGGPALAASNGKTTLAGSASRWGYADFDGDSKPDLAELRRTYLNLRLSTGSELHLASVLDADTPGSEIVIADLDGDHDLDIVIHNRFLKRHSEIWLNDGEGFFRKSLTRNFSFPFERGSWSQSPAPDPGIALTDRNSKPLDIAPSTWFVPPPSSGRKLHAACGICLALSHADTSHLRGPPIPSGR